MIRISRLKFYIERDAALKEVFITEFQSRERVTLVKKVCYNYCDLNTMLSTDFLIFRYTAKNFRYT